MARSVGVLVMSAALFCVGSAGAQDAAGLAEARAVAHCLHTHNEHIQRFLRLIEQAEQRSRAPGIAEDVRRDALASIETLVERIREHAAHARHCIDHHPIAHREPHRQVEAPPQPGEDSLGSDRGTVHEVERGTRLSGELAVVSGERVDGSGTAPDESVRAAIRSVSGSLSRCYDQYLDRASRRSGELHLSFTAYDGGRVSHVAVEHASTFDPQMRQCVERAAGSIVISGQRGRAVYAYVFRFGD